MYKQIQINQPGGVGVLSLVDALRPVLAKNEVLVRQTAVGVNFIDIYMRSGLYPLPSYPAVPGKEAAGVVEEIGEAVTRFSVGDRVCYVTENPGAYATYRAIPETALIPIPDSIPEAIAAGMLLQGLTARFLVKYTYRVKAESRVLVHAAAGGVGSMLVSWASHLGATVIGTAGSDDKIKIALEHGCAHVINYRTEDVAARVMEITEGKGVNVVYDGVGRDTFAASLDSLMELGLMVSFGQSSGAVAPFDLLLLKAKSLFLTRPQVFSYIRSEAEYITGILEVFDKLLSGILKPSIGQTYHFADAAKAHDDLENRRTTGSSVLIISEEALYPKTTDTKNT